MKHKKNWNSIFYILILVLLVSCANEQNSIENSPNILSDLVMLSSDSSEGRYPGSLGHERVTEYIINQLNEFEIEPVLNNEFIQTFSLTQLSNTSIHSLLTLTDENGGVKILNHGIDYLENANTRSNVKETLEYTFKIENQDVDKSSLLVLQEKDFFYKSLHTNDNSVPYIQISTEIADFIKNNNPKISYEFSYDNENIKGKNVIAGILNENAKKAIILSAHYDHIGKLGDVVYSGAYDNSSGVALLLDLIRRIKGSTSEYSNDTDIIFCFFDGEESDLQGSKAFVNEISDDYESLININFDCIGSIDSEILDIVYTDVEGGQLYHDIQSYFENSGVKTDLVDTSMRSDHISFSETGFQSVTLSNIKNDNFELIHTNSDVIEIVDYSLLNEYSELLKNLVYKLSSSSYLKNEESHNEQIKGSLDDTSVNDLYGLANQQLKDLDIELKYDEYIKLKIEGLHVEYNGNRYLDWDSLNEYYPSFAQDALLVNMKFKNAFMSSSHSIGNIYVRSHGEFDPEDEYNKVLKRSLDYKNGYNLRINAFTIDESPVRIDYWTIKDKKSDPNISIIYSKKESTYDGVKYLYIGNELVGFIYSFFENDVEYSMLVTFLSEESKTIDVMNEEIDQINFEQIKNILLGVN